jgi:hypothetical protein
MEVRRGRTCAKGPIPAGVSRMFVRDVHPMPRSDRVHQRFAGDHLSLRRLQYRGKADDQARHVTAEGPKGQRAAGSKPVNAYSGRKLGALELDHSCSPSVTPFHSRP